jgi:hypothetical protein
MLDMFYHQQQQKKKVFENNSRKKREEPKIEEESDKKYTSVRVESNKEEGKMNATFQWHLKMRFLVCVLLCRRRTAGRQAGK